MLSLSLPVRVYLCLEPTDMRRSFDGLCRMVREHVGADRCRAICSCSFQAWRSRQAPLLVGGWAGDLVSAFGGRDVCVSEVGGESGTVVVAGGGQAGVGDSQVRSGHVAGRRGPGQRQAAKGLSTTSGDERPGDGRIAVTVRRFYFHKNRFCWRYPWRSVVFHLA